MITSVLGTGYMKSKTHWVGIHGQQEGGVIESNGSYVGTPSGGLK